MALKKSDKRNIGTNERTTVMGMSASQARFLGLTARKTNVEYEGQQINQQRTTLSNESANYYSQLANMSVPTPPSTTDYAKTTYSFTDGSETNTINSLIAQKNGYYILNYTQSTLTDSVVSSGTVIVNKKENKDEATGDVLSTDYYVGASKLRDLGSDDTSDPYLSSLNEQERKDALALEVQYKAMLTEKYKESDWLVKYQKNSTSGTYEPVFYNKRQVAEADYSEKTGASLSSIKSYTYGQATETREIKNAKARVEQDTSGRYISIFIYETDADGNIRKDENGNEIGSEYSLTTTTKNDDNAYNDAINQYNYNKAMYDQEIQSINSKIEIIQGQDKNLELRLKQLDTEENAISTEIDSVKKVISKNVESSFKTFNA